MHWRGHDVIVEVFHATYEHAKSKFWCRYSRSKSNLPAAELSRLSSLRSVQAYVIWGVPITSTSISVRWQKHWLARFSVNDAYSRGCRGLTREMSWRLEDWAGRRLVGKRDRKRRGITWYTYIADRNPDVDRNYTLYIQSRLYVQ